MEFDAVLFDYDGVITVSENIKTEAFAELFTEYGKEAVRKVLEFEKTSRISRFEKFKFYYKEFTGEEISQEKLKELGGKFSDIVNPKVMKAPFVSGVIETIIKLRNKGIPCFVVTGAPKNEAENIIEAKAISHYFESIYGAPKEKADNIKEIVKKYNYNPKMVVFLGDAFSDLVAAEEAGIEFIGITCDKSIFPDYIRVQETVFL